MGAAAVFTFPDPGRRLRGVRLMQEIGLPAAHIEFGYDEPAGAWRLEIEPPVLRMEYRLALEQPDGGAEIVLDPAAPTAPGAFGPKSERRLDGYAEPSWLDGPAATLDRHDLGWPIPALNGELRVTVYSPAEPTDRLLVAHDGPEFAAMAGVVRYAEAMIGGGQLPAFHLALLDPGDRNAWYSANPAYADALATVVLPALRRGLGTTRPAAIGASLGAVAMLHLHRRHPSAVRALFLQSGSFFVPEYDAHESGFAFYRRLTGFVRSIRDSRADLPRVPVEMTCGVGEENLACNRLMCSVLSAAGYPATLHEVPDAHNFVAWRDAFDPHLTAVLADVWR